MLGLDAIPSRRDRAIFVAPPSVRFRRPILAACVLAGLGLFVGPSPLLAQSPADRLFVRSAREGVNGRVDLPVFRVSRCGQTVYHTINRDTTFTQPESDLDFCHKSVRSTGLAANSPEFRRRFPRRCDKANPKRWT